MPKLQKQALSQYLRLNCDRYLYHSLTKYEPSEKAPLPLAARPGVAAFRKRGLEFESEKFEELSSIFGPSCTNVKVALGKSKTGTNPDDYLQDLLLSISEFPTYLIEPTLSEDQFKPLLFALLGLDNISGYPDISDMRPDLLEILDRDLAVQEGADQVILSSGEILDWPISDNDQRKAIRVIDMKATEKINVSYASEVVAYSLILASWIESRGLQDRFVVLACPAIWVKSHTLNFQVPNFSSSLDEKSQWVKEQTEIADANLYLPVILKFLQEDIPRVLAAPDWNELDWGVTSLCSQCDYLGFPGWSKRGIQVVKEQAKKLGWEKIPTLQDYCYSEAVDGGLAMQIPSLTRGMRRTLHSNKLSKLTDVTVLPLDAPEWSEHHGLKQQSNRIPDKATAILSASSTVRTGAKSAQLARYSNLRLSIYTSYESSSNMLIGLGLGIDYREPGTGPDLVTRKSVTSIFVEKEDHLEERARLVDFLTIISNTIHWVQSADTYSGNAGRAKQAKDKCTVQVTFWDRGQFDALREAIGRHLHVLVALNLVDAVFWLFPPDNLVGSDRTSDTPPICFLKDVILNLFNLSTSISDDVISTAESLVSFDAKLNDFTWDRVSGSIPKERAMEIWQNIPPKNPPMSLSQCRRQYEQVLEKLIHAIRQLTFHISINLGDMVKGEAPQLSKLNPTTFQKVAADSLLWLTHHAVSEGLDRLDQKLLLCSGAHELESRFVGLRTDGLASKSDSTNFLSLLGIPAKPTTFVFNVRPDSKHVKFRNDSGFLSITPEDPVGAGLMSPAKIIEELGGTQIDFDEDHWRFQRYSPLYKNLGIKLKYLDRDKLLAVIEFDDSIYTPFKCVQDLIDSGVLNLNGNLIVLETAAIPSLEKLKDVAVAIGNPSIALPDKSTTGALLKLSRKPGSSKITPPAEILWQPDILITSSSGIATNEVNDLLELVGDDSEPLNSSQRSAVLASIEIRLALVWGGPGTGKTKTLVNSILVDILLRIAQGVSANILITAPTYRALSEVATRFRNRFESLPFDTSDLDLTSIFIADTDRASEIDKVLPEGKYCGKRTIISSRYKETIIDGVTNPGITLSTIRSDLASGSGPSHINLLFAVSPQIYNLAKGGMAAKSNALSPLIGMFDKIWLDESSQLSVANSLPTLATLREGGSISLFGDTLQMPPIQNNPAPVSAEHMVGSIHSYLKFKIETGQQASLGKISYEEEFLDTNYRSNKPIVDFCKAIGYPEKFKAANGKLALSYSAPTPDWDTTVVPDHAMFSQILTPMAACVAVSYDDGRSGQANELEAAMVVGTVLSYRASKKIAAGDAFDESNFWSKEVGIVTPHRAQRGAIVSILQSALNGLNVDTNSIEDAVDTVERFQGGERELILISFGLGDPDLIQTEEEFLFQKERINVAISRAKRKVVLFVTRDMGLHLPDKPDVIEASKAIKKFVFQHANQPGPIYTFSFKDRDVVLNLRMRMIEE